MKKYLLPLAALLSIFCYNSCSKDKAQKPSAIDCSTIDSASNTYNLKIKAILDNNCTTVGCHDAIFQSNGINLSNYADVKSAFESGRVMGAVNHEQGFIAMPNGLPKLADSLITYMQCWQDNNYPQ